MKKIISLIILIISSIGNINAQEKDTTKVQLTKETIYKDVKSALAQIGDALKVGAEHVYGILVKQQVANSVINLVIYISTIIVVIVGYKTASNTYKGHVHLYQIKNGHDGKPNLSYFPDLDDTAKGTACVIESVITCLVFIIGAAYFFCTISETITGFINPEYGAIKEIINFVK